MPAHPADRGSGTPRFLDSGTLKRAKGSLSNSMPTYARPLGHVGYYCHRQWLVTSDRDQEVSVQCTASSRPCYHFAGFSELSIKETKARIIREGPVQLLQPAKVVSAPIDTTIDEKPDYHVRGRLSLWDPDPGSSTSVQGSWTPGPVKFVAGPNRACEIAGHND
jgi:hypothetical protein